MQSHNDLGLGWGWKLGWGYESWKESKCQATKQADELFGPLVSSINRNELSEVNDEIFSHLQERVQALKEEVQKQLANNSSLSRESQNLDEKSLNKVKDAATEAITKLKAYYNVFHAAQCSENNVDENSKIKLDELTTSLKTLEAVANEAQGKPSRAWQGIGVALIGVGAAVMLTGVALVVSSAVMLLGVDGFVFGGFCLAIGGMIALLGLQKINSNASQDISRKLKFFGDSIKDCQESIAGDKKSCGERMATPFQKIYRNWIR